MCNRLNEESEIWRLEREIYSGIIFSILQPAKQSQYLKAESYAAAHGVIMKMAYKLEASLRESVDMKLMAKFWRK